MKIGQYEISLTIKRNEINVRAVVKEVNNQIPKSFPNDIHNKLKRILIVRDLGEHFPESVKWENGKVQLVFAKEFVEKYWGQGEKDDNSYET